MDAWAVRYAGRATFVCVGCAGESLAAEFISSLKLRHTHVTYVERQHMPRWGQLGCSGFIVLDGSGRVACPSTSAYLEVRQRAFRDVEKRLDALLPGATASLATGQRVRLCGLSRAELNGELGVIVEPAVASGRCSVELKGGRRLSVKVSNVQPVDAEPDAAGDADELCGVCEPCEEVEATSGG